MIDEETLKKTRENANRLVCLLEENERGCATWYIAIERQVHRLVEDLGWYVVAKPEEK